MKITLWKKEVRHENGRMKDYRHVTASMTDTDQLVIFCCDINRTAEAMFGDAGVEFELVVEEEDRGKLHEVLQVPQRENQALLDAIYARFGETDEAFEDIMDFFRSNAIAYTYNRW